MLIVCRDGGTCGRGRQAVPNPAGEMPNPRAGVGNVNVEAAEDVAVRMAAESGQVRASALLPHPAMFGSPSQPHNLRAEGRRYRL